MTNPPAAQLPAPSSSIWNSESGRVGVQWSLKIYVFRVAERFKVSVSLFLAKEVTSRLGNSQGNAFATHTHTHTYRVLTHTH